MVEKFDRFLCHILFAIFYVFVVRLYNNCKNNYIKETLKGKDKYYNAVLKKRVGQFNPTSCE